MAPVLTHVEFGVELIKTSTGDLLEKKMDLEDQISIPTDIDADADAAQLTHDLLRTVFAGQEGGKPSPPPWIHLFCSRLVDTETPTYLSEWF